MVVVLSLFHPLGVRNQNVLDNSFMAGKAYRSMVQLDTDSSSGPKLRVTCAGI